MCLLNKNGGVNIYIIYNLIFTALAPLILIYILFTKNNLGHNNFLHRFGFISKNITKDINRNTRTIWFHAVSVGEINAITTLVNKFYKNNPDTNIIISTITATGQKEAKEKFSDKAKIIYLPFDFFWSAKRIMKLIKPDIFITIETEIWPNMIKYAKKYGSNILMINGRISSRSINKYMKIKKLMTKVLNKYDKISVITNNDKQRLKKLGANKDKIVINGNLKYDHLNNKIDKNTPAKIRSKFSIKKNNQVLIAGSTRSGENKKIIDTFNKINKKYNNLVLIIAPRHLNKAKKIQEIASKYNFSSIYKTEIDNGKYRKKEKIIILNTIGDLFDTYSIGDIIFCGASLVPKGGQNIMEAAVWGKAVLYGPSMEDFKIAKEILEQDNGGIQVSDKDDLYDKIIYLLKNPEELNKMGENAKNAVLANKGASKRNIKLINKYL